MKKIFLLILLSAKCFSQAPTIQWQKSFGGYWEESANSVLQTPDGGYIFAGRTNSTDGDVVGYAWGQHNPFYGDVWIVKTNATGTIEWQKLYGGFYNDAAIKIINTTEGGYLFTGNSESSNGTVTGHIGNYDYWVVKLNTTGDIEWQKNLGGTSEDLVRDIKQTADGGYIAIGHSSSNLPNAHGMKEVYLVKLSGTGTIQWWKAFGGSNDDIGHSVSQTLDGGYILTGTTKSANGNFTVNKGMTDIFIIKTNAIGTIEWQKTIGGTKEDFGHCIIALADGSYVLSGATSSTDGDITTINRGSTDLWVAKMDTSGTIIWQKSYGGTTSEYYDSCKIYQTSEGGFITMGTAYSNDGDCVGAHSYNTGDVWTVKLNSEGNKQWQRCFGGRGDDYGLNIIETVDKGYMISGTSRNNIINPAGADWTPSTINNTYDAWLIKLNPDSFLLNNEEFTASNISVYPNPVSDVLNIDVSNINEISKIIITDMLGKKILEQTGNFPNVSVQNLAKGVYTIQVFVEGENFTSKFIKQ